jgi:membrane protein required for colicin V production
VTLDVACLVALAAAALAGAATGALRQLAKVAAAGLAVAGARVFAPSVAAVLVRWAPPALADPAASAATFLGLYLALALLLGLAARAARAAGAVPASADRGLGALLGGAKAALVLWVLVSVLVAWGKPLPVVGDRLGASASDFAAFARTHGALGALHAAPVDARTARERRDAAAAEWGAVPVR